MGVYRVHGCHLRAEYSACQGLARNGARAEVPGGSYVTLMSVNARKLLRDWMEKHGLSMRGWAAKAGISESSFRGYLKGDTESMTVSHTRKLARAAGVPFQVLVEYTGGDLEAQSISILPAPSEDVTESESQIEAARALLAAAKK